MSARGADSGIKQGAVVEWADPRAELDDIKAQGARASQLAGTAAARLAEFTRAGRWRELLTEDYRTVAEFLAAEFPWLADLAIPVSPRRELVALMSAQETPQKAIASALGVSPQTVSLDIKITNFGDHGVTSKDVTKSGKNVTKSGAGPKTGAQRAAEHRDRTRKPQDPQPSLSSRGEDHRQGTVREPVPAGTAGKPGKPEQPESTDVGSFPAEKPDVSAGHPPNGSSAGEDGKPGPVREPAGQVSDSMTAGTTGTAAAPAAAEPGPEPGPEPQPCPRCAPQIAHLEAELAAEREQIGKLKAAHPDVVQAEEIKVVTAQRDALRAEAERLQEALDEARQADPGADPGEPGNSADSALSEPGDPPGPGGPCQYPSGCGNRGFPARAERVDGSGKSWTGLLCGDCFDREEAKGGGDLAWSRPAEVTV